MARVWGCDETPVFFDTPHNQTMEKVGAKEVRIKSTGGDKKNGYCYVVWMQ